MEIALFGKYKTADVVVKDDALRPYINIVPRLLLKSHGRHIGKFAAAKTHLVERLANRIAVPGHLGKKHRIITSWASGKYNRNMRTVIETLDMIEQKKKESPIQVLVRAIENAAPRDETTTIERRRALSAGSRCQPATQS